MKKTSVIWVAVIVIILSSIPFNLISQDLENPQNDQLRIGFGISYGKTVIFNGESNLQTLINPLDVSNFSIVFRTANFRIEPSLGYFSSSRTYNYDNDFSTFSIGAKIATANLKVAMNYYFGIDFGIVLSSSSDGSKTDFYVGPVIGAEYMISEIFSLGGEIQLNYMSIGQYGDKNLNKSQSYISSGAKILLRCYVL